MIPAGALACPASCELSLSGVVDEPLPVLTVGFGVQLAAVPTDLHGVGDGGPDVQQVVHAVCVAGSLQTLAFDEEPDGQVTQFPPVILRVGTRCAGGDDAGQEVGGGDGLDGHGHGCSYLLMVLDQMDLRLSVRCSWYSGPLWLCTSDMAARFTPLTSAFRDRKATGGPAGIQAMTVGSACPEVHRTRLMPPETMRDAAPAVSTRVLASVAPRLMGGRPGC